MVRKYTGPSSITRPPQKSGLTNEAVFGTTTVVVEAPTAKMKAANVKRGQHALARAMEALTKPGVTIALPRNVPLFRVDRVDPRVLIRTLDGKTTRGRIVRGKFVPLKSK
jgi:hypothetical protein